MSSSETWLSSSETWSYWQVRLGPLLVRLVVYSCSPAEVISHAKLCFVCYGKHACGGSRMMIRGYPRHCKVDTHFGGRYPRCCTHARATMRLIAHVHASYPYAVRVP